MKHFFKLPMYVIMFLMTLIFSACNEEFEEVDLLRQQETLSADSTIAELISKTASNDGSFDNVVDGASCIDIKFPYTVAVNGLELTITSREDLQLIEEIFDALDTDDDILEIIFPITITLADFTEITINSPADLRELVESCIENGDDDDIECIDFVYPITLFTYDANNEQTARVEINSDLELRRFFNNLEEGDVVGVDYPVTLALFDGTTKVVNSNMELQDALERAKDICDEDDDDDFNDDDFTKERLDHLLVECPWLVKEVKRDNQDRTDTFFEYAMNFRENGEVVVRDREGNNLIGSWATRVTDNGALLRLEFDVLVDFTLEWMVYDIGERGIKLFNGEGNRIILKQWCEMDENEDPDTLREILRECSWIIKKVKNEGQEVRRLLGYAFSFEGDGVVTLSNGENTATGSWEIGQNAQGVLVLAITMGSEPGVSFEWPLRDLDDSRLKFEVEGFELVLLRECEANGDDDIPEIRNILFGGAWTVAQYMNDGVDQTSAYEGYSLAFDQDNRVTVSEGSDPILEGLWRVLRDNEQFLKVFLNFEGNTLFEELTDDWDFVSITTNRIELKDTDEYGHLRTLVLEK
ncbi:hypothetical protein [Spongiimicrobium salis]|uniref:hypothetical protein n=1 Tax=Spongiimicrobium salis TaxID=1667022 RepID=UPI00374D03CD